MCWCSLTHHYRFHDFFNDIPHCNINIIAFYISYWRSRLGFEEKRTVGR